MNKLHPMLQPAVFGSENPYNAVRAAHLLNRAGFGGTPEEIAATVELGPAKTIDAMLDFPDAPADEQSQSDVPDLSAVGDGYPSTFDARRALYKGKTEEEKKAINQMLMEKNREAIAETLKWWLKRMAHGPYPMQEKLTLFWHGHFTTSARDERSASSMWAQNELLRRNCAGNFRTFVKQVSRDPAMLDYLNNQQNRKAHPNENYARELMELFTLGIGNYTEDDVKQGARAFTGWGHDGEDYIFRKFDHDYGPKTFLGRTGNFDGDDVIEIILGQEACGNYIANCLLNFFVTDTPDPEVAKSLGDVLRQNNYDLRPMLATLFTSKYFYDDKNIGAQIKCPIQLVIGTQRMLAIEPPNPAAVLGALDQMGQVPFAPPNVKGWPGGRMWINTSTLFVRYNTAVWLAGGGQSVSGGQGLGKFIAGLRRAGKFNERPNFAVGKAEGSPQQLVDEWVGRLIQRPMSDDRKKVLVDALVASKDSSSGVKKVVQLIVSTPEYQLC